MCAESPRVGLCTLWCLHAVAAVGGLLAVLVKAGVGGVGRIETGAGGHSRSADHVDVGRLSFSLRLPCCAPCACGAASCHRAAARAGIGGWRWHGVHRYGWHRCIAFVGARAGCSTVLQVG